MADRIADGLGHLRAAGDAGEVRFEEGFEFIEKRPGLGLADFKPCFGALPADAFFDLIEGCDLAQCVFGERRVAGLCDLVEAPPKMGPAERQDAGRGGRARCRAAAGAVSRVPAPARPLAGRFRPSTRLGSVRSISGGSGKRGAANYRKLAPRRAFPREVGFGVFSHRKCCVFSRGDRFATDCAVSQPVRSLRHDFRVCENRRHSRGLGGPARVSGLQFQDFRSLDRWFCGVGLCWRFSNFRFWCARDRFEMWQRPVGGRPTADAGRMASKKIGLPF